MKVFQTVKAEYVFSIPFNTQSISQILSYGAT